MRQTKPILGQLHHTISFPPVVEQGHVHDQIRNWIASNIFHVNPLVTVQKLTKGLGGAQ